MNKQIAILAGDGIGPEVMEETLIVLDAISNISGIEFIYKHALVGGAAYDEYSEHLPKETVEICKESDAILFGSVGGPVDKILEPKWKNCEVNALLGLRKFFNFNINLRPARVYKGLEDICPLKISGKKIDILVVRELVGGIYFGEHKRIDEEIRKAIDVCEYDEEQIRSVSIAAFEAAKKRNKKLTSVDKANVLETSKLWREVVKEVSDSYPDVEYEDMLVDNCAMQLIKDPSQFDVIVTSNMFGDILSDAASMLPGSLGLLASASLNESGFAMYEPSGGSAQDIVGKGIANPIAQILSAAMMLKYSFSMAEEANIIEKAVNLSIANGARTADIAKDKEYLSTKDMTEEIIKNIEGK